MPPGVGSGPWAGWSWQKVEMRVDGDLQTINLPNLMTMVCPLGAFMVAVCDTLSVSKRMVK